MPFILYSFFIYQGSQIAIDISFASEPCMFFGGLWEGTHTNPERNSTLHEDLGSQDILAIVITCELFRSRMSS